MSVDLSYYFFVSNGGLGSFSVDPIWSTAPSVFCAVSRANPIMAKTLLTGLKTLVDNQFIDQQLHRYKGIAKEELQ
jgi:polar amino acid transport system substrate-binding protein